MLALRSILVVRGARPEQHERAAATSADAVVFDLASPETHEEREALRSLAARHIPLVARRGRGTQVRVADARSGELEADLEATVGGSLHAVILAGAEEPQDVRDADVAIRKHEMRRKVRPGQVRLIPEVDSAAGLQALPSLLTAVDRHAAVALNLEALAMDLGMPGVGTASLPLFDHAMSVATLAASAAHLQWLLLVPHADAGMRSALANRAHALGAGGAYVRSESEANGFTRLFSPRHDEVQRARAILDEWERVRASGGWVGVAEGALVDRRTIRRARAVLAVDEAVRDRGNAR
jgi:citrate lyase subunit beta/citryl-CoA lyase